MKLEKVHVTNFRSAEDSEEFNVGVVTCLVGKNEAGKSAILLALAALNPHPATPAIFDKERDYPRRSLTNYDQNHPKGATAIKTSWRLASDEMTKITEAVGAGVVTSNVAVISRKYGDPTPTVEVALAHAPALEFLYTKFALDSSERAVLAPATTSSELITLLAQMGSPSARHNELKAYLANLGNVTSQVCKLVLGLLPKFMYFSSYDRMDGAIQLENAKQLMATGQITNDANRGVKLFTEFLDYAGVSLNGITGVATYETFNAQLQAASNNITDQILEYWTQNPDLSVVVRVEQAKSGDPAPFNSGTVARARIHNSLHRVDTPFSERSAGFVWFFSFLVKFAQVKDDTAPVVLLLDEPGLTLHGKAQADLLRFFQEKLVPHHQIIYSTHSPFMVPADDLASIRIVQDQVELRGNRRMSLGTKVRDDVLTRDPDTLFPLQGALGYEITQSLFVGKNTLLVEGPSDILYLQALSHALRNAGRTGLDSRWTLCPAGGIDKIRPFVSLFSANTLNLAVLTDQAAGDKRKLEELKRSEVLKAGHLYTMADFLEQSEADIEDIFEPAIFAKLLNACYELKEQNAITAEKLRAAEPATDRRLKQAEALFKLLPSAVPVFDHFTPSAWLIENPQALVEDSAPMRKTLDRAERIFTTFNRLLP